LWVVAIVLGVHLTALMVGFRTGRRLGMSRADQIAVGFAGSQKTLMVGLQICMELGFHVLPMVAYHISQLLVDTLIADRLKTGSGMSVAAHAVESTTMPGRRETDRSE
jgi:sodium/bile acid cotransporter 7